MAELERRLDELKAQSATRPTIDRARLLQLAHDLPAAWNAASADTRTKQRLIHILIREIVCDLDDASNEAVLLIHWTGGRHTEVRVPRVRTGRYPADRVPTAVDALRKLAGHWPDREIGGLSLSEAKTRIVHIGDGFNFLGFNIRRFPNGKLLTQPQKEKATAHRRRLSQFLRAHRQLPTAEVIRALAPVIRGWCNYYRHGVSKRIFSGSRPNEELLKVPHLRRLAVLAGPKNPFLQPSYVAFHGRPADAGPVVEIATPVCPFSAAHHLTSQAVPSAQQHRFGDTCRKSAPFRDGYCPIRPITGRPSLSPASSTPWPVSLPCGRATTRRWGPWGLPS